MLHQPTNSAGNFNYNAFIYTNQNWGQHFHKNFELIYVIEGSANIGLNNDFHKLEKGELLLIFPYDSLPLRTLRQDLNMFNFIPVYQKGILVSRKNET